MPDEIRVLVTGGSGFVAGHLIVQLLDAGYLVRTTVRNLAREKDIRHTLAGAGADLDRLEVVAADLNSDDGWTDGMRSCRIRSARGITVPAAPAGERG